MFYLMHLTCNLVTQGTHGRHALLQLSPRSLTFPWTALLDFNLALHWIFVLGQRFDHYECGKLSWLGQLYGALYM